MNEMNSLRVMSWNIWWRFGPWKERAPAIAATLAKENADIICLQEVWDDGEGNFAAELADSLDYHHVFAPGAKPNGVYMGNAILSRWPINSHEIVSLYDEPGAEEMRVAIRADIIGPKREIPVFCTHLNYLPYHSAIRQKQVADVLEFIDAARPWAYPPILCGDFNADPMSDEIRTITGLKASPVDRLALLDAWDVCNPGHLGFTWNTENPFAAETREPNRRIDYIFAGYPKANGHGHLKSCRIAANAPVEGIWPSDHFALIAELNA